MMINTNFFMDTWVNDKDLLCETFGKSQITIGEISDIFDAIFDGSESTYSYSSGETGSFLGIQSCISDDLRMHHTGT